MIIDRFLQDGSALDANRGITYVMLSDEEDYIVGYYNIENGRVDRMYTVGNIDVCELMGGAININYFAITRTNGNFVCYSFLYEYVKTNKNIKSN